MATKFVTKKKLLKDIQKDVKELSSFVKTKEYEQLKKDSQELHEIKALLSNIHFKIKDAQFDKDEKKVLITYELPKIVLDVDENGEVNKNDFFYSVNVLELISLEDMQKILKFLEGVKQQNVE